MIVLALKRLASGLRRRRVVIPLLLLAVIFVTLSSLTIFQPKFIRDQIAEHNPEVLFFHETKAKVIALTIDDAPDSLMTPALLDLFAEYEVKVTFFAIGDKAVGQHKLLARMVAEGHELGNHMMKDTPSIMLSEEEFSTNLLAAEVAIGLRGPNKWWRPASGWFSPDMLEIAAKNGYRCCLGSLYPLDNKIRQPKIISWLVRTQIHPGAVLVLHEGGRDRDYILPLLTSLIPRLKAAGYQFLTVSDLDAWDE